MSLEPFGADSSANSRWKTSERFYPTSRNPPKPLVTQYLDSEVAEERGKIREE